MNELATSEGLDSHDEIERILETYSSRLLHIKNAVTLETERLQSRYACLVTQTRSRLYLYTPLRNCGARATLSVQPGRPNIW